ncbi:MAG: RuvX/YqgF family protein [bacterium]|nr:RuvX/YqgF family protein [bacterium]MDZ4295969.1 RuvX/YqgF family protein [Patescibacteria group bacterium]
MTLLGIDYGKRWVGLALGSSETRFAFPLQTIEQGPFLFSELRAICKTEGVTQIIIGLPQIWRGNERFQRTVKGFGEKIGAVTGLPVAFAEEVFTSLLAKALSPARPRHSTHAQAAALILENHFVANSRSQITSFRE